ncbi:MAG: SurA N-terminal domain-containing protein [marine benthic group bacterium]|jgi:peptidyl-prolyl cis-trans isomerase D|nr:SurA N-terminal domain-containing protein [Candidatus Carthagonibacter metallireducens]MCL7967449.1 SurA N-terminal domain-containing protein [Gemmatimonadota bacterium]MCL7975572.1 SurA N-terminal domain-containing protein [Gemmatimonadota bacterium]MCL7977167.1 SurA N-terminal domain-containing protein [Gemmatimonadota bacterium]MCL7980429.1 SurA N-terminal domain-containing protein [Gemmatimonadota bacterium]
MFMRSIRANTKWVMLVMAVAFAAWLVFDWVNQRDQAASQGVNPVIATVNGKEVRNVRWNEAYGFALDAARAQSGRSLTDEERRQVENEAWEGMIQDVLVEQEIERLGIEVTESEIRQAFRTSPPPDLVRHPAFQTDGNFDYAKYQQFFADPTVDEQLLMQIEQYYRQTLPRARLAQQISGGTAVSDGEVWQAYRDQNESATVTFIAASVDQLAPSDAVEIAESDARAYYRANEDDFTRPASAVVQIASFSTTPTATDTAFARSLADSVRAAIEDGDMTFESAAAEYSADSLTADEGGLLGRFGPDQLVPVISDAVAELDAGEIAGPVATPAGFRLLTVTDRSGDTASVAHILFPIVLSEAGEDEVFREMDDFEGIALNRGIEAAGEEMDRDVRGDVTVTDGFDFVPGVGSLGVGVDWAVDPLTPLNEVSEFFENGSGFHMLEVVSRTEPGTLSFEEARPRIESILADEVQKREAAERAEELVDEVTSAPSLEAAAEALGWTYGQAGPFTRGQFVQGLGRGTEAVGAAFGSPIGTVMGPFDAGDGVVFLRVEQRNAPDSEMFQVVRGQLRSQLESQLSQTSVNRWVQALRDEAEIVDLRDRLRAQQGQV